MISLDINTEPLTGKLNSLRDASGKDAVDIIKDESRMLGQTITNYAPPPKQVGGRKAGDRAVEYAGKALFTEYDQGLIDDLATGGTRRNIDGYRIVNGKRVHFSWEQVADPEEMARAHHERRINGKVDSRALNAAKTGDSITWKANVSVTRGARAPYITKLKLKVGKLKATWALTVKKLNGNRIPTWISRHFNEVQSLSIFNDTGLNNPQRPLLIFGSRCPGIVRMVGTVNYSVRLRAKAVAKRLQNVSSEWAKDWKTKSHVEKAAHKVGPVITEEQVE